MQALRSRAVAAPRPSRANCVRTSALFGLRSATSTTTSPFYDFVVNDINGRATKMSQYKGKVVLLVNVASACGFTPQYEGLQSLYDKYKSKGLVVLACPCNAFGGQEPGSNSDIQAFAKRTYGITFPLMAKMEVNGQDAEPLWDWAKSQKGGFLTNDIKWNFSKFLISREGEVVGRFGSTTTPEAIEAEVAKLL